MEKILSLIDQTESRIFMYDLNALSLELNELVNCIVSILVNVDNEKVEQLNEIVNDINIVLANKDYLLLADILEYQLKHYINSL
jgi:hypothetical protein